MNIWIKESRNKPINVWSIDFKQGCQNSSTNKEESFQQMV